MLCFSLISPLLLVFLECWVSYLGWASRWDAYLKLEGARVHWFSILNSLMVIFFSSWYCVCYIFKDNAKGFYEV